jgi:hypothetical protein
MTQTLRRMQSHLLITFPSWRVGEVEEKIVRLSRYPANNMPATDRNATYVFAKGASGKWLCKSDK